MEKPFVNGSVEWLIAMREGAFANRPPVPSEPPREKLKSHSWPSEWAFPAGLIPTVPRKPKKRKKKKSRSYNGLSSVEQRNGSPCFYCKRAMAINLPGLRPTRDHVHPRCKGGREIVWACDDCNAMKDKMTLYEWRAFMAANPNWWEKRKARWRNTPSDEAPGGKLLIR